MPGWGCYPGKYVPEPQGTAAFRVTGKRLASGAGTDVLFLYAGSMLNGCDSWGGPTSPVRDRRGEYGDNSKKRALVLGWKYAKSSAGSGAAVNRREPGSVTYPSGGASLQSGSEASQWPG